MPLGRIVAAEVIRHSRQLVQTGRRRLAARAQQFHPQWRAIPEAQYGLISRQSKV